MKKYASTKQIRELMNKTLAQHGEFTFRTWTNRISSTYHGSPDRVLYWNLSTSGESIMRSLVARLRAHGFSNKVTTADSSYNTLKAFAPLID